MNATMAVVGIEQVDTYLIRFQNTIPPVYRDLSNTGSMYGGRTTSGRTGVMMVVVSVWYIHMHRGGYGYGEGNGGGEGGWYVDGGGGE